MTGAAELPNSVFVDARIHSGDLMTEVLPKSRSAGNMSHSIPEKLFN